MPSLSETSGLFNFLEEAVKPSLYRNGQVLTRRDPDGNDFGTIGLSLSEMTLQVSNARDLTGDKRLTCDANGFELLDASLDADALDFFNHNEVVHKYYGQCTTLVEQHTGARAYAFDHNIRSATGKKSKTRISGGQDVQDPLHLVHGDYTLFSAPQRLRDLTCPPSRNDTLSSILKQDQSLIDPANAERVLDGGRFAIINVWRNISEVPVAVRPLALCYSQSVRSGGSGCF